MLAEPLPTALLLTTFGTLLALAVFFSRATERVSVPVVLIFLITGMLAGSEGIGGIVFENYAFSVRLGTIALVLILFDGGLNTSLSAFRQVAAPAGVLATIGVIMMAGVGALGARALGLPWPAALLVGAVVSSTDAAAVFAVLRGSGLHLKRRVGITLEVESGANDPMAVILTLSLTNNLVAPSPSVGWQMALDVLRQIIVGVALGIAIGNGGRFLLRKLRVPTVGLYPALTLALAFLAFGVPTVLGGSGFLAVYITGMLLGSGELPYRPGLVRVHAALAWLSQITMFLVLGLLVFPSRLLDVAGLGLALALFLTVVARPLVVALCLIPFRYPAREIAYIGWVGLRGAVPIILGTFPVLAGAPGAMFVFDVVFFIVVFNAFIPGATLPWVTRRAGLEVAEPPSPKAVLEIESMQPLNGELMSFYIDPALAVAGVPVHELPFPDGAAATLLVRGQDLIAPKGNTVLEPGDHLYVFSRPEDKAFIQLMFGRPET
ncbi:MAG TPA: potassium/proton antiporter [Gemmatimonadaceae bacterium]|nr:potassium/proton antiporter [Gemmatimonadaceae bacterium]